MFFMYLGANDFIEFDNAMEPPTNNRYKVTRKVNETNVK